MPVPNGTARCVTAQNKPDNNNLRLKKLNNEPYFVYDAKGSFRFASFDALLNDPFASLFAIFAKYETV